MKIKFIILSILFNSVLLSSPIDVNTAHIVARNIYIERSNIAAQDDFSIIFEPKCSNKAVNMC